jgi:hypothetical protein
LVRQPPIQHRLQFHISPRDRIPHHDQIHPGRHILCVESPADRDPVIAQKIGHRRKDSRIGSRHHISPLLHRHGDRAHGRAANADKVNVPDVRNHVVENLPHSLYQVQWSKTTKAIGRLRFRAGERTRFRGLRSGGDGFDGRFHYPVFCFDLSEILETICGSGSALRSIHSLHL